MASATTFSISSAIHAENERRRLCVVGRDRIGCDSFVGIRNNWYLLGHLVLHRNRIARLLDRKLPGVPVPNSALSGEHDLLRLVRRRKARGLEPYSALRMDTNSRPNPVA